MGTSCKRPVVIETGLKFPIRPVPLFGSINWVQGVFVAACSFVQFLLSSCHIARVTAKADVFTFPSWSYQAFISGNTLVSTPLWAGHTNTPMQMCWDNGAFAVCYTRTAVDKNRTKSFSLCLHLQFCQSMILEVLSIWSSYQTRHMLRCCSPLPCNIEGEPRRFCTSKCAYRLLWARKCAWKSFLVGAVKTDKNKCHKWCQH